MRVLVTGVEGFVGRHLVPVLREHGHEVLGTTRDPERAATSGIPLYTLDVTDAAACARVLHAVSPTHVVHLAAMSSVRWSFDHPQETHQVNVEGTRNVLQGALAIGGRRRVPKVLLIGSAEEYGPNDGTPLRECPVAELRPLSPYAQSKVAVEVLVEESPPFRTIAIRTRSFPHFGPAQGLGAVTADHASQLVRIARGELPPLLPAGNVDAARDYTDVRDVVRAYALLLERGVPGEVYNVCSGRGVAVKILLDTLARLAGVTVDFVQDPAKVRPTEIPSLVGDCTKLRAVTGWEPTIPLEQSLADILAWWKAQAPTPAVAQQETHRA